MWPRRRFDIPAGLLQEAAQLFQKATSLEISMVNQGIGQLATGGVSGVLTPEQARAAAKRLPNVQLNDKGANPVLLDKLPDWLRAVAGAKEPACAFVIDYASRIPRNPQDLTDIERDFFAACEKLAQATNPPRSSSSTAVPPFNPIIWLINRPNDLPDWFIVGNEAVRTLVAALPDRDTREKAAASLAEDFADFSALPETQRNDLIGRFADLTDGFTLRSMKAIADLALPLAEIADSVRCFKVGVPDNPWRKLKEKIRDGEAKIGERVKGQALAARKALDIIIRSAEGLTGAQTAVRGGRPRGVLFFAGPTGVGKTELAKAITQLIFGDEQAYRRFDMSEFSAEHSDARLIGAPPGYVGYDAGGELVNAIRQRPFSVLLFDEIEKAHPRILDKFLQVLEDGRLTDGRGETVYFSEAVIVFTSNLGMFEDRPTIVEDEDGRRAVTTERVAVFDPKSPPLYDEIQEKVGKAIEKHFRFKLERPELLNRIGDNIVVFDFIRLAVAEQIFERMLRNVVDRVRDERRVSLQVPDTVGRQLLGWCTEDLSHGGRGIGNKLETVFINPLARALFDLSPGEGRTVSVRRVSVEGGIYAVDLA
jgi:energy-coupling factor transporter ATP-binding protein EcfA2